MAELAHSSPPPAAQLEVTLALSHAPAETETHPQFPAIRLAEGMVDAGCRARPWPVATTTWWRSPPARRSMVDNVLKLLTRDAKISRAFVRYDKFA